jgi:hypothetical protein
MFDHGIENDQELAHARRERHLLRFPRSTQALIEGPDHRIEPGRDERAHIEDRAHLRPSAPDRASPPQRAAVAIQRRHADEGRDLLVTQRAQLRQVCQQRGGQHRAQKRYRESFLGYGHWAVPTSWNQQAVERDF